MDAVDGVVVVVAADAVGEDTFPPCSGAFLADFHILWSCATAAG